MYREITDTQRKRLVLKYEPLDEQDNVMATPIGSESKKSFHDLLQSLKSDREHLAVQMNLGKKELRDEWAEVEKKWGVLDRHLSEFTDDAKDAAHRLSEEINETYHRLKNKLK